LFDILTQLKTIEKEVNRVEAECRGNHIRLEINGSNLFQIDVESIGPGWAGMMVGTTNVESELEVVFDNIEIWGPTN